MPWAILADPRGEGHDGTGETASPERSARHGRAVRGWGAAGEYAILNAVTDRGSGGDGKGVVLLVATMGSFFFPFMGSAVNIALPSMGEELAMDAITLSWVATSYLLASAAFLVPFGRLADIHGRKKVFTCGVIVYTLSSLLAALAGSPGVLIAFRALQGMGGAMLAGTGVAMLTSVFPPGERGRALGINVAATYTGLSAGPPLGGVLTQHLGWRSIFFVNVPLGLVILAIVLLKLKGEWAEARGERFDLTGTVIYVVSLVAAMYGVALLPGMVGVWLTVGGALGLLGFARWELRAGSPILDIKLFRNNTVFAFSNLAALINYSATFAVAFLLSLYLQYIKGFDPQTAGLVLVAMPVVQAIFSPLAGRLSDRVEPRVLASFGMGLTAMGLVLFVFLGDGTRVASIIGTLVLLGFGFACFSSPNTNAVMSSVANRFYGVASATVATMRQVGMVLSMAIAMFMFELYLGKVQITPEYYPLFLESVRTAFIVFSVLCFGGVFASLARGRVHGGQRSGGQRG